ncbi:hypothetical protein [uncultured Alsobacter sp.]|uniref:hypothetical protein n=1 Tax=uncultured Alsobacter sp. TaxID=1748258 RepID=UPI0025D8E7F2|nr:hypothetical protein [uncultured Alsobacter sp.]
MAQVHDAAVISLYRAGSARGHGLRRGLEAAGRWVRGLLTDGLTADAFLVLAGHESVAVLLRRPDGYVLVARNAGISGLDGQVYAEAEFARDAVTRALARTVSLSPVWYS